MRLGLGMKRRGGWSGPRGSAQGARTAPLFPPVTGWDVTEGRWRHAGAAGWVICAANEPRGYVAADGTLLGYLIEGAETFRSAPWHDPAAPHGTADFAYLAKTAPADAIAYAGGHALADIHGGSGKGVVVTQGATANGILTASNVTCATVAGDIVRCEMLFSIPATAGQAGTIAIRNAVRSGTGPIRALVLNHDGAGQITGWNAPPAAATHRAGYAPAGTRSDGTTCWFVWMEFAATGSGVLAPAFGLPTAIAGRAVMIHDLRILCNPQTAPKAVPVLAANKTFAADTLLTGIDRPIGVLFHRLARCRTRITDGRLADTATWARSGPYLPYENRVQIVPSAEAADAPGILPNEFQDVDFIPWLAPAQMTVILGPGYYNQRVSFTTAQNCTNLTITSAFKAEPTLMAQLERLRTSRTYLTGNLTVDDLILFSRASEVPTQFEQVDLISGQSALNTIDIGANLSARRCLWASHPATHSRARGEAQEDENDNRRIYIGSNYLLTNGGTCDLSGSHFWRLGRSFWFDVATTAATLAVNADDCCHDQIWSDAWYFETGTYAISFNRNLFGRFTTMPTELYQSRKQIEVDTGAGWTDLAASGVALAALPVSRKGTHAGTWDFATGTFTAAPVAGRSLRVRSWDKGSTAGNVFDRPGYQWHASQVDMGTHDAMAGAGDVYVFGQDGPPSPAKPWVRLTFDLGYWSGATTFVVTTAPATVSTGTHADTCQVNRTSAIVTSIAASDCVILGDAQGPFLTGNVGLAAIDSDVRAATFTNWIVITKQSWAFEFDYSKTPGSICAIANALALPMANRFRYSNGTVPTLGIRAAGSNNTITLSNVHIGHKTGATAVSGVSGGTVTGTHDQVHIGEITDYAVTEPAGSPAINDLLDPQWLDPFTHAVRDDIDPLDPAFTFTLRSAAMLGIAVNPILAAARGSHARWAAVKARINRYHFPPDHVVAVAASAPVGTVLLTGLAAAGWMPLWSGNEKGYFAMEGGALKVAKPLAGINQCWLLQTVNNQTILLDIQ